MIFLDNASPKAIHIAKSHKADRTSQNLSISMSLPTLKKMLTKLKEMERMKRAQGTTKAISNAGKVVKMKVLNINKQHSRLKRWCNKTPNASYTSR